MCIIIDANAMHVMTKDDALRDLVHKWIIERGRLVYNYKLIEEYSFNKGFMRYVQELTVVKKAKNFECDSAAIAATDDKCESDDPHIVHLAKSSRASVLFSFDQSLHKDFKNNDLVGGHDRLIFQTEEHKEQLMRRRCP